MGWFSLPEIRIANPFETITTLADMGGRAISDAIIDPVSRLAGSFSDRLKEKPAKEAAARTAAYNDALSGNLDAATKQQIESMYNSGSSSVEISKVLADAKEAKGVYFVRKEIQRRRDLALAQPGRQQTVLSLGQGTVLGGGRGY